MMKTRQVFRTVTIDSDHNRLLCNSPLVGIGEIVEVYEQGDAPPQSVGRLLQKIKDPDVFVVNVSYDGHEAIGKQYEIGERCVFRVVCKNASGARRRKFAREEKVIVNTERGEDFHEAKIVRAKTGSVRSKRKKKK